MPYLGEEDKELSVISEEQMEAELSANREASQKEREAILGREERTAEGSSRSQQEASAEKDVAFQDTEGTLIVDVEGSPSQSQGTVIPAAPSPQSGEITASIIDPVTLVKPGRTLAAHCIQAQQVTRAGLADVASSWCDSISAHTSGHYCMLERGNSL